MSAELCTSTSLRKDLTSLIHKLKEFNSLALNVSDFFIFIMYGNSLTIK